MQTRAEARIYVKMNTQMKPTHTKTKPVYINPSDFLVLAQPSTLLEAGQPSPSRMESLASSTPASLLPQPCGISINCNIKAKNSISFRVRGKQVWCSSSSSAMNASPSDRSAKNAKEAKLWGGRFEESVTEAVERFTESVSFDKALYKQDIRGSRAHASMLAQQVLFSLSYF